MTVLILLSPPPSVTLSLSFLLSAFLLIKFVRFLSDPNFLLYDMKDRAKQP